MATKTSSEQPTWHMSECPQRQITVLRGDADLGRRLAEQTGLPDALAVGGTAAASGLLILCLQPTAWWLVEPNPERGYAAAWQRIQSIISSGYQVDISAAQTVFRLQGVGTVLQLGRMSSLDFRAAAFPLGRCLRARVASVAVVLHRVDDDTFDLYCPRTYADYMRYVLDAARPMGSSAL